LTGPVPRLCRAAAARRTVCLATAFGPSWPVRPRCSALPRRTGRPCGPAWPGASARPCGTVGPGKAGRPGLSAGYRQPVRPSAPVRACRAGARRRAPWCGAPPWRGRAREPVRPGRAALLRGQGSLGRVIRLRWVTSLGRVVRLGWVTSLGRVIRLGWVTSLGRVARLGWVSSLTREFGLGRPLRAGVIDVSAAEVPRRRGVPRRVAAARAARAGARAARARRAVRPPPWQRRRRRARPTGHAWAGRLRSRRRRHLGTHSRHRCRRMVGMQRRRRGVPLWPGSTALVRGPVGHRVERLPARSG
jgi:hypothetical protein